LSLEYFEGPAGCGKTYQLVVALRTFLKDRPLEGGEAVLGLTYMHGSRRRMHSRLAHVPAHRGRLLVCTVDSLARQVVCRWRTLARDIEPQLDVRSSPDFACICRVAASLMGKDCVSGWLRVRYPVVVVDELQDCKGDHLCMIQALESCCHVVAAADEFQDLRSTGANAAIQWLHDGSGKKNILTGNRRTTQHVLLAAAQRLRSSEDCGVVLKSNLTRAFNANVGAGGAARALCYQ
jgi:superfamily I DNA/RNA helicase